MQLAEYMKAHTQHEERFGLLKTFPRIKCADGFSISIQAGHHAYCSPRDNCGSWYELEAGFPSDKPSAALLGYAEEADEPTKTIYAYVPLELLQAELDLHGGIAT